MDNMGRSTGSYEDMTNERAHESDVSSKNRNTFSRSKSEALPKLKSPFEYGIGDIGRALKWKKDALLVVFLFAMFFTADQFQYYVFSLVITSLPGNKFVNSCIFGGAESAAVLGSGVLMKHMKDTSVFYIVFVFCMASYCIFIFVDEPSDMLIYIANSIFVGSMGAW